MLDVGVSRKGVQSGHLEALDMFSFLFWVLITCAFSMQYIKI